MTNPEHAQNLQTIYGVNEEHARVLEERQSDYGNPKHTHESIACAWAGILRPWALRIARGEPVPAYVVSLMMASMKLMRARSTFKDDNYVDAINYTAFGRRFQREHEQDSRGTPPQSLSSSPVPEAELVMAWRYEDAGHVCFIEAAENRAQKQCPEQIEFRWEEFEWKGGTAEQS